MNSIEGVRKFIVPYSQTNVPRAILSECKYKKTCTNIKYVTNGYGLLTETEGVYSDGSGVKTQYGERRKRKGKSTRCTNDALLFRKEANVSRKLLTHTQEREKTRANDERKEPKMVLLLNSIANTQSILIWLFSTVNSTLICSGTWQFSPFILSPSFFLSFIHTHNPNGIKQ